MKLKRKKINSKKENPSKLIKIILFIILFLAIILFLMLIIQSSLLDYINSLFRKPKMFAINDACSLIFSNVIHQIKNEGDCKISCRSECQLKNMNFYNINFIPQSSSCNICNCYCK